MKGIRHFLELSDIPRQDLRGMIEASLSMKAARKRAPLAGMTMAGKTLALIFERPSTRTRVSFELAMRQLGGDTIVLTGAEMQLGRGETIADTARVLSRYVDAIMIRILDHAALIELATNATVPIINGLTKRSHPCQVLADVMTFEEHRGSISGRTVAWTGDANNVLTSWMHAAERFEFRVAGRHTTGAQAEEVAARLGQGLRRVDPYRQRPGGGGQRRRLRRHRHLGLDGRQGRHAPP